MKKILIMLVALTISGGIYGAQLEVKGGYEPWREGNSPYSGFDLGGSLGAELLFNAETRPFDYGLGMEWKSKFLGGKGDHTLAVSEANAFPLYLTGKYSISEDLFYLVGRAGWTIYDDSYTNDGFYGAVGVGKEFGKFTLEVLYESMDYSGTYLYSEDRAALVSIKFGYRFGENKRDRVYGEPKLYFIPEIQQESISKLPEEKVIQKNLDKYNSQIVTWNYPINELEPQSKNKEFFKGIKKDFEGERGKIRVTGYTDDIGSKVYNLKLSKKRADRVAKVIEEKIINENIKVISEGLGESSFLNKNTTKKERKNNRRVEINYIEE